MCSTTVTWLYWTVLVINGISTKQHRYFAANSSSNVIIWPRLFCNSGFVYNGYFVYNGCLVNVCSQFLWNYSYPNQLFFSCLTVIAPMFSWCTMFIYWIILLFYPISLASWCSRPGTCRLAPLSLRSWTAYVYLCPPCADSILLTAPISHTWSYLLTAWTDLCLVNHIEPHNVSCYGWQGCLKLSCFIQCRVHTFCNHLILYQQRVGPFHQIENIWHL